MIWMSIHVLCGEKRGQLGNLPREIRGGNLIGLQISWEVKFILCCSTTTIPTDVRVSGKAREVYKECPTLRKRLGKMLQKLLSPCKEKWTQKRVRSWGERISSNIMVSFLSSTSWWGIEKINNLEIFLCIWALIMKILNVFQPITSYERIGEASILHRLSRRAGSLLFPPLVQPFNQSLTRSSLIALI